MVYRHLQIDCLPKRSRGAEMEIQRIHDWALGWGLRSFNSVVESSSSVGFREKTGIAEEQNEVPLSDNQHLYITRPAGISP